MKSEIRNYNDSQSQVDKAICDILAELIDQELVVSESKIWHGHPVWFLNGNPIVGYSKLKSGINLLFWSGQSFNETGLSKEGKYKAAGTRYTAVNEINPEDIQRWLKKARDIQWDYKNIVKRKGVLEKLF